MQGWRKRMEDSHISDLNVGQNKNTNVFGVFDGHGGKEVAVFVKKHFTEELVLNSSYKKGDLKKALTENFLKMDEIMVDKNGKAELKKEAKKAKEEDDLLSQGNNKNNQMELFRQMIDPKQDANAEIAMFTGCTACVCTIYDGKLYFANAGDSRAVVCKKGVAYAMSIDHKPELEIESSRIEKAGGWVTDGRVKGKI
jgi:protein phosphatase 1G